ncbi:GNAT family N-acetyltransferase [Gryllotalpicola protaetiae]|uniref:GNAT family N-acetyltransferase n=1 Tax=Gryllotalpicola protaetiae TaxID=2419771 RepID=A0A387BW63_9MICO|nr:GNAT family N-acetyltransferase [Gryllotalpicola protaetiae]AYG05139.1 GNAT family N-acetyltransferase [Gryllotalpicola protaetiae]
MVVCWIPDAAALYLFGGPAPRWPFDVAQLSASESRAGHTAWVLVEDDVLVGQFELTVTGDDAWLSRVILDPAQRGRDLAHVLVASALDQARAQGASRVGLHVIVGNHPAIRSYAAAGFAAVDGAERPDVVAMRVDLQS